MWMGLVHPEIFGALIVMSPSVWWDGRVILRMVRRDHESLAATRIWVDVGANEGRKVVNDVRQLAAMLPAAMYTEDPTATTPSAAGDAGCRRR